MEKNPLKFYDQVFNQDITKHKVVESPTKRSRRKSQATISSKVTKRPYLKIFEKIQFKLSEQLREKIGSQFAPNIMVALKD